MGGRVGCLFWIFSKQIPGQPVLQSFLMATLPPEPGGGGRVEERGETSVGNLGSQAKQRGVLAHLLFVLFYFIFSPLSHRGCLPGRERQMFWAISEEDDKDQTHPHLLPLDTSPDATPSVLSSQGTQDLGLPKFSEAGWVEMQLEVSLLGVLYLGN